ncbi:hypothetical protein EON83_03130 [bacterium]|nr:MAG: hypothetical protein EON83_03130 [bacterium]
MKIHLSLLIFSLGVVPLFPVQAQKKANTKIDVGKIKTVPLKNQTTASVVRKVGEVIKFTIWAEGLPKPKYSNMMNDTSPYKPFGTLTLGGDTYWNYPKPPREYAASWVAGGNLVHNAGERIKISEDTAHTNGRNFEISVTYEEMSNFKLLLDLRNLMVDGSAGNNAPPERVKELAEQNNRNYANPPLMGHFDLSLNLEKKGDFVWVWSNGDRLGSKLHLTLKRVGYMYKSNAPQVGPVIKKPDLPGRIPGPGPVSKVTKPVVIRPSVKQKIQVR